MTKRLFDGLGILLVGGSLACAAGQGEEIPLWAGAAPGANGAEADDIPTLTIYLPSAETATGAGVVICPGGGYGHLAMEHEGRDVAAWLNRIGVAGFVLKYRLPAKGYRHPIPLGDAQRALRLVRSRAGEFGLNPARVGVLGFSAGGHLASTLTTHYDAGNPDAEDPVDRAGCRPDFSVLGYPVITMDEEFTHKGSKRNLLGPDPDPALVTLLSNEKQITKDTPPCFIFHADDDRGVLPRNSIEFYMALQRAGVSGELHIYRKGGHGFGIGRTGSVAAVSWQDRCADWLGESGFLGK